MLIRLMPLLPRLLPLMIYFAARLRLDYCAELTLVLLMAAIRQPAPPFTPRAFAAYDEGRQPR